MYNNELNKKLKQLNIEDFIWLIYIGIIILSWYSNSLERKYFLSKNYNCKRNYQNIMILIFSILVVVYLYFLKSSLDDYRNLKVNDSYKKKKLVTISLIASLCIAISGFLLLYIAFVDDDLTVEIAFN
ncbi:MAG: hypothetical protein IKH54_04540 [Bacilli bacterium]|nr:hypothetical protein [Bacilli bacterium]